MSRSPVISRLSVRLVHLALAASLLHPVPLLGQEETDRGGVEPELAHLLEEHRHPTTGTLVAPSGPGFELLVREGLDADFFLIGESHMMEEVPALVEPLLRRLAPEYGLFAVETGPLTAEHMVERLERGGLEAMTEVAARYPFTIPFYEQRPEAELLDAALEEGYEILGVDQEFMGSGRYWLDRLAGLAPDREALALVERWQEREAEAALHYRETGSSEKALLSVASPGDFDTFAEAFAGEPDALEIVEALRTSAHIYQLWRTRNFENNRVRVDYMRRNLVEGLRRHASEHGESSGVLLKFGSYHTGRGFSPANQLDLGNLAHNLATLRDSRSVHVWTVAVAMRQPDGTEVDLRERSPVVRLLSEYATGGPWTIFDVRPLRPWFHRERNRERHPELADAVFQHDFIAVAEVFTRSEALAPPPG